jgi:hypothetical protein
MNLDKLYCAVGLTVGLALSMAAAQAQDWPRLTNGKQVAECNAALSLALLSHKSASVLPWTHPYAIPDEFPSDLVLGPKSTSLTGGDVLEFDTDVFTQVPLPEYKPRSIYWQTDAVNGKRLVVEEVPLGWQGDMHRVRVVDQGMTAKDYLGKDLEERNARLGQPFSDGWRAPFVFRKKGDSALWMMYIAEPGGFSGNWKVFVPAGGTPKLACEIQFRPQVKRAVQLLPRPVQKLAALLDRTLGSGKGESFWQPTARVRASVQQTWANAALRPWVADNPYNTRDEVEENLLAWSQQDKKNARHYAAIRAQYAPAERALAQHYARKLRMPADEAASTAKTVLDTAFRMYFVINKEQY